MKNIILIISFIIVLVACKANKKKDEITVENSTQTVSKIEKNNIKINHFKTIGQEPFWNLECESTDTALLQIVTKNITEVLLVNFKNIQSDSVIFSYFYVYPFTKDMEIVTLKIKKDENAMYPSGNPANYTTEIKYKNFILKGVGDFMTENNIENLN